MSEPPASRPGEQRTEQPQNIATAIAEVSERATHPRPRGDRTRQGGGHREGGEARQGRRRGRRAGVFVVMALVFALVGFAWLLVLRTSPVNDFAYFWGFFAMAVILAAPRSPGRPDRREGRQKSSPPVPAMAIDEARKIRETFSTPTRRGRCTRTRTRQPRRPPPHRPLRRRPPRRRLLRPSPSRRPRPRSPRPRIHRQTPQEVRVDGAAHA